MDETDAIGVLAALAQPTRLAAFRALVAASPAAIAAGEIARRLDVPHNTLSTHLAALARAGLVTSTRDGRAVLYRADLGRVKDIVGFIADDCCGGRPELCRPLAADIVRTGTPSSGEGLRHD